MAGASHQHSLEEGPQIAWAAHGGGVGIDSSCHSGSVGLKQGHRSMATLPCSRLRMRPIPPSFCFCRSFFFRCCLLGREPFLAKSLQALSNTMSPC